MPILGVPIIVLGLIGLFLATLPLGAVLLRIAERLVGHPFGLSGLERALLAFYATGGLLYVIASVPAPVYTLPVVAGLLSSGAVAYAVIAVREHGRGARSAVTSLGRWPALALLGGTLGLLALEVGAGNVLLPNGIDGAMDALFTNLILRGHTSPWTLAPFSSDGVIYPQAAPVWMTLPVLLFGWPVVASPVVLPPLFLGLSVPAGFCLGERLHPAGGGRSPLVGLLFALNFGVLVSWPRLFVGGSYDFLFALPLFLVLLGLLRHAGGPPLSWSDSMVLGAAIGVASALSASVGVALLLLWLVYALTLRRRPTGSVARILSRYVVTAVVSLAFVARSIVGVLLWYSFPGHVITDSGAPPYAPGPPIAYPLDFGELDPFQPWKGKISPIPLLSLELQLLLVGAIVLSLLLLGSSRLRAQLSIDLGSLTFLWVGTATLFVETGLLLVANLGNSSISGIQSVTNLWETSLLLFVFFELLALVPAVAALNRAHRSIVAKAPAPSTPPDRSSRPTRVPAPRASTRWTGVLVALVVVVPSVSGTVLTVTAVPGYLHTTIRLEANVTQGDVDALEWAGGHLPGCSRVLMAPGSAAQFLPEYSDARVVYPAFPYPTNLSYYVAVSNLTAGVYVEATRTALLQLGVTDVFVTGQTADTELPFLPGPLLHSSDFRLAFQEQDALVFEFLPEIASTACAPSP